MSVVYDITAENLRGAGFRPIHAGDSYNHRFVITRASAAIDLTNALLWFTVKDDPIVPDSEAKLQLRENDPSTSSRIEVTDAVNGKFAVRFKGEGAKNTEDLEGEWDYDCQAKLDTDDEVITLFSGKIEFLPNITRSTT